MKETIVIDLDGVIATGTEEDIYSDKAGWKFEKCKVMPGAKEGLEELSKKYNLILSTARWETDIDKTHKWLEENNLKQYFTEIRINSKPSAIAYIDDRAIRFKDWRTTVNEFKDIKLVRAKLEDWKDEDKMKRLHSIVCDKYNAEMATTIVSEYEETVNYWYKTLVNFEKELQWFAYLDGEIIGWVECWNMSDNTGWLLIMLHKDYQGKGLGRKVIEQFEKECFETYGLRKLFLGVYSFNPNAQRLYEKCGWELEGIIKETKEWRGQLWDRRIMSKKPQ